MKDHDRSAKARKVDRCRQPRWPRANDNRFVTAVHFASRLYFSLGR